MRTADHCWAGPTETLLKNLKTDNIHGLLVPNNRFPWIGLDDPLETSDVILQVSCLSASVCHACVGHDLLRFVARSL